MGAKVKSVAIGAGIVLASGFIASKAMAWAQSSGQTGVLAPDGAVIKYSAPLAGGGLAILLHLAGHL
jgi:hypothetical protein